MSPGHSARGVDQDRWQGGPPWAVWRVLTGRGGVTVVQSPNRPNKSRKSPCNVQNKTVLTLYNRMCYRFRLAEGAIWEISVQKINGLGLVSRCRYPYSDCRTWRTGHAKDLEIAGPSRFLDRVHHARLATAARCAGIPCWIQRRLRRRLRLCGKPVPCLSGRSRGCAPEDGSNTARGLAVRIRPLQAELQRRPTSLGRTVWRSVAVGTGPSSAVTERARPGCQHPPPVRQAGNPRFITEGRDRAPKFWLRRLNQRLIVLEPLQGDSHRPYAAWSAT